MSKKATDLPGVSNHQEVWIKALNELNAEYMFSAAVAFAAVPR